MTHWKRPWCWERLRAGREGDDRGGEGDDRGWDGWMASPTQWAWVWVNSGSWRWTGRPVMLQSIGSQRVGCDWATDTYLHYSGAFFVCLFVFYYFLFDTIISTRLLFYSSSLSPTVSNFSKKPGSFYWKRVLGTKFCAFFCIIFFQIWGVPLLLDTFSSQNKEIYVCIHMCRLFTCLIHVCMCNRIKILNLYRYEKEHYQLDYSVFNFCFQSCKLHSLPKLLKSGDLSEVVLNTCNMIRLFSQILYSLLFLKNT